MVVRLLLVLVLAGYAIFTWFFITEIESKGQQYEAAQLQLSEPSPVPVAIIRFADVKRGLIVPSWKWLDSDRLWVYVSSSSPIGESYLPKLIDTSVTTGGWLTDKRVHPEVGIALTDLFNTAKSAGFPLTLSSTYRSAKDQKTLYDNSSVQYGKDWTQSHVALPTQSEHQTGLAIDITSKTDACLVSFSNCNLDPAAADWLAKNAHLYGFVLRYPPEKSHITGISHEPWHYRYVGKYMAQYVVDSGLTLDEILRGLIKSNDK